MKKRILSLFLVVALVLSLGVTMVAAAGEKFDNKNNINIVYFGGSQTQLGLEEGGWCRQVTNWFSEQYTGTTFNTIDASYGGMGSNWGFMRAKADVISKNADIVFIDFALNDNSVYGTGPVNEENGLSYVEAMVRSIMSTKEAPKVFFIYTSSKAQITDEASKLAHKKAMYHKVAEYYGIPEIDVHEGFCKLDGVDDLFKTDNVHYSQAGNSKVAEIAIAALSTSGFIKAPVLKSELYVHANRYSAYSPDEYKVVDLYNDGKLTTTGEWEVIDQTETAPSFIGNMDLKYINPKTEESTFSYKFKGDMIGFKFIVNSNGADADIYIDDVLKGTLVMNSTSNFPNAYMWKDLGEGWHTLKVVPKNIEGNCYIEKIYTSANSELPATQSVATNEVISNPILLECNSIAYMGKVGWNTGLDQIHYIHTVNKLNFIYRPSMKLLVDENNMITSERTGVKYYFPGIAVADYYNGAIAVPEAGHTVKLGNVAAQSVNFVAVSRDFHYPDSVNIDDYKVTLNYTDGTSEDKYLTIYDYLAYNDSLIASPYIIQGNDKPVMDSKYNMFEYSVPVQSGKIVSSITFGANQTSIMVYAISTVAKKTEPIESKTTTLPSRNSMTYYTGPGWTTGQDQYAWVTIPNIAGPDGSTINGNAYWHIHRPSMQALLDSNGVLTSANTGVKYDFSTVMKADFTELGATVVTDAGYSVDLGGEKLETVNFIATVRDANVSAVEDLAGYKVAVNYTDGTSEEKTVTIYDFATSNNSVVASPFMIRGFNNNAVSTSKFNMFEYSIPITKEVQSITFKENQPQIIVFAVSGKIKNEQSTKAINTIFDITKYCNARSTAKPTETGHVTNYDAFRGTFLINQENVEKCLDENYSIDVNGMKYSLKQLQNPAYRGMFIGKFVTSYANENVIKTIDFGGDYYSKIGFLATRRTDDVANDIEVSVVFPVTLNYVDGTNESKNVTIVRNDSNPANSVFGNVGAKWDSMNVTAGSRPAHICYYEVNVQTDKPLESVTFGGDDVQESGWIFAISALGVANFEVSNGSFKTEDEAVEDLSEVAGEKVNLEFKTKVASETAYELIVAFYSDNGTRLEKVNSYNCEKNLGVKNETVVVTVPEEADNDWKVKAFLWDELEGMTPIHDVMIIK